ncbi:MAG: hypothetical protein A3K65_01115 [Euryarchaeota archaeon RBG_16_68_12]|nr:MAG: hypothetical protein A3K65_01115 [Euryarchaeota archaeon RBG_16_68_12]
MALTAAWSALSSGGEDLRPINPTGVLFGFALGFAFFFGGLSFGVAGRVRGFPGIPLRYLGAMALLAFVQLFVLLGAISPFGLGLMPASSGTWTGMGYAFGAASASASIAALLATPRREGSARTAA